MNKTHCGVKLRSPYTGHAVVVSGEGEVHIDRAMDGVILQLRDAVDHRRSVLKAELHEKTSRHIMQLTKQQKALCVYPLGVLCLRDRLMQCQQFLCLLCFQCEILNESKSEWHVSKNWSPG